MPSLRKSLPLLILLVLLASSARAGTWTAIDVPGATDTVAYGINSQGDVVGGYDERPCCGFVGFLLSGGVYTSINAPNADETVAIAINSSRHIAGYFDTRDGIDHGFIFDGRNYTILDFPGAKETSAFGINDEGTVTGAYSDSNFIPRGFVWKDGNFTTFEIPGAYSTVLAGINNLGSIVGQYYDANLQLHSFVLNSQGKVRIFPFKYGVFAINDRKIVAGLKYTDEKGPAFGIRFNLNTGALFKMRYPGADVSGCEGIDNFGQVVGFYSANNIYHGFLWSR